MASGVALALLAIGCTAPSGDSAADTAVDTAADTAMQSPYQGGWPFNPDKDALEDPGWESPLEVGRPVPRLLGADQYGDVVDLYDFSMQGKLVVVDLSALWCAPCNDVAAWLAGQESVLMSNFEEYESVPALVEAGEVYWITVLFEDLDRQPAQQEDAEVWHDAYPARIPVLLDDNRALHDWIEPGGHPTVMVLDESMRVVAFDRYSFVPALDAVIDQE